ncbi:MAG: hypothetical protein ACYTG0_04290, partial [Planctomycetota bacterium]
RRLESQHATGFVHLAAGAAACLSGRWSEAVELSDQAQVVFREHCMGVPWELHIAQAFSLIALSWSGQIAELTRRLPLARAAVQKRGDLYNLARLGTLNLPELAANRPDRAERELHHAAGQWQPCRDLLYPPEKRANQAEETPKGRFSAKHFTELYAQIQIDLYRGEAATAWERMSQAWPLLSQSLLLRIQLFRVMAHYGRARCALATSAGAEDPKPYLETAEQDRRQLKREREGWVRPLAELVGAALAAAGGDVSTTSARLKDAITHFTARDMELHAAIARRRLGELTGGDAGSRLIAEADSWMLGQNIVVPDRITGLYAPGFPARSLPGAAPPAE